MQIEEGKKTCYCVSCEKYVDSKSQCYKYRRCFDFMDKYPENIKTAVYWWVNKTFDTTEDEDEELYRYYHWGEPRSNDSTKNYKKLQLFAEILCMIISIEFDSFPNCFCLYNYDGEISPQLKAAADLAGVTYNLPTRVRMLLNDNKVELRVAERLPEVLWTKYQEYGQSRQRNVNS